MLFNTTLQIGLENILFTPLDNFKHIALIKISLYVRFAVLLLHVRFLVIDTYIEVCLVGILRHINLCRIFNAKFG